ncbi:MAG TPA: amidase family protein, partial [Acidimicrobiia bacterium]|nr:amidase family protein [Acidimicrobiia bacterium]
MADTLGDHDATGLASLVRAGEVTPTELVEAAISRIETVDPLLNCVIHRRFERARDEAARTAAGAGPFAGVPFLVKDITCHQAGEPFHEGMRFLRDRQWREHSDTHLAARFRAAGLITLGRTNAPEL